MLYARRGLIRAFGASLCVISCLNTSKWLFKTDVDREENIMAEELHDKFVKAGDWRTLESGWNAQFGCRFVEPNGARVKIRYGVGWLGWDSQKRTLDGVSPMTIQVTQTGVFYARIQMKVSHDANVSYTYIPA
jgi:hypothetical protein